MDELNKYLARLSATWGYLVAGLAALVAAIGFSRRHVSRVQRALALSDLLHAVRDGATPEDLVREIGEWTRQGTIRELRLTLLEETSGIGIYVCDASTGACLQSNTVLAKLFGMDEADIRGFGWLSAVDPEDRIRCFDRWAESVKKRVPYEDHYTAKNLLTGRTFRCLTRSYPAMTADGKLLCYVGTVQEVHE